MVRVVPVLAVVALVSSLAAPARADSEPESEAAAPPPFRFSVGAGGAALLSGADGETWRGLAAVDLYPGGGFGRFGASFAVRQVLLDPYGDAGLATVGVTYEAAAARPRLVMALHAEGGLAFADGGDELRPAIGGGLKTHLGVIGPLALASDVTAHLVANDVDDLSLVFSLGAMIALAR